MGANGQGKSTLVKLMLGELRPKSGTAIQHPQARIGVFAQSNVEDLVQGKGQLTVLKHMKALFPEGERLALHAVHVEDGVGPMPTTSYQLIAQLLTAELSLPPSSLQKLAIVRGIGVCAAKEQELRGHLGSFGIKGSLATTKMSQLSGGQAVRVGIAAVAYAEPHLLVLVRCLPPHSSGKGAVAVETLFVGVCGPAGASPLRTCKSSLSIVSESSDMIVVAG